MPNRPKSASLSDPGKALAQKITKMERRIRTLELRQDLGGSGAPALEGGAWIIKRASDPAGAASFEDWGNPFNNASAGTGYNPDTEYCPWDYEVFNTGAFNFTACTHAVDGGGSPTGGDGKIEAAQDGIYVGFFQAEVQMDQGSGRITLKSPHGTAPEHGFSSVSETMFTNYADFDTAGSIPNYYTPSMTALGPLLEGQDFFVEWAINDDEGGSPPYTTLDIMVKKPRLVVIRLGDIPANYGRTFAYPNWPTYY